MSTETGTVPTVKENLVRTTVLGTLPTEFGLELIRAGTDEEGSMPVMRGHFAVFNQWTEIDSLFEGHFMERFAPGSMKKTLRENRDSMRVLFQHGMDPMVGDKPLGPIRKMNEDGQEGAYYEVPLLDASYVRDLVLPGLEAGLYGASHRFSVLREEIVQHPEPSDANPHGIPERTVKEASVREFGPVTFPAYENASAGVRSFYDDMRSHRVMADPEELLKLVERVVDLKRSEEPPPEEGTGDESDETPAPVDAGPEAGSTSTRRDEGPRKPLSLPKPRRSTRQGVLPPR